MGLAETLRTQSVVVLAPKYARDSYLGVTALLAVGLPAANVDFVVDCLELKDHMHLLRAELLRPDCLKLVRDPPALLALQRDFRLYVAPAIDLQTESEQITQTGMGPDQLLD